MLATKAELTSSFMVAGPGSLPQPLWRLNLSGRNGEARVDLRMFALAEGPARVGRLHRSRCYPVGRGFPMILDHDTSRALSAELDGLQRMAWRKERMAGSLLGPCLPLGPSCRRSCRRSWSEPRPYSESLPVRPVSEQPWLGTRGRNDHSFAAPWTMWQSASRNTYRASRCLSLIQVYLSVAPALEPAWPHRRGRCACGG